MARYIDADAFSIEPLKQSSIEFDAGIIYALRKLDEQPTADVIEVVLCKDCKYFAPTVDWYECEFHEQLTMPDNYCSFGERTEDGN